jgi:hypothetical protein
MTVLPGRFFFFTQPIKSLEGTLGTGLKGYPFFFQQCPEGFRYPLNAALRVAKNI